MISTIGLFFIGLQMGATACAFSCMPIMTPILLSNATDKNRAYLILLRYFSGKVSAYTLIAVAAFFGANLLKLETLPKDIFTKIGGIAIAAMGIYLLVNTLRNKSACKSECSAMAKSGYFSIGFLSSFSLCLPLSTLITVSALSTSLFTSAAYGLFFGFGVVLFPFLFFYFFIHKITSSIFTALQTYKQYIELFAALLLILIGTLVYRHILKL